MNLFIQSPIARLLACLFSTLIDNTAVDILMVSLYMPTVILYINKDATYQIYRKGIIWVPGKHTGCSICLAKGRVGKLEKGASEKSYGDTVVWMCSSKFPCSSTKNGQIIMRILLL